MWLLAALNCQQGKLGAICSYPRLPTIQLSSSITVLSTKYGRLGRKGGRLAIIYLISQASNDLLFHRLKDPMHTFFNETVTAEDMIDVSQDYEYDRLDDLL